MAGYPDKVATIVSGNEVAYQGRRLSINAWGQEVTGWLSINIYASVHSNALESHSKAYVMPCRWMNKAFTIKGQFELSPNDHI